MQLLRVRVVSVDKTAADLLVKSKLHQTGIEQVQLLRVRVLPFPAAEKT